MIDKKDIQQIIDECCKLGAKGLGNGVKAQMEELNVDFLSPPTNFLGLKSNPAVFVNPHTYTLLGKTHPNWKMNKTIAVQEDFLKKEAIMIIGILVHETGHAFNVAARITNSELNAYIFEIEIMQTWFQKGGSLLFNCTKADLKYYFETRLPYYRSEAKNSPYLAFLITKIENNSLFDLPAPTSPKQLTRTASYSSWFFKTTPLNSPREDTKTYPFFVTNT